MTAYEVRISDWSSDVCSSDLIERPVPRLELERRLALGGLFLVDHRLQVGRFLLRVGYRGRRQLAERSEERRIGKECVVRVDLGGSRIIKKKNHKKSSNIAVYVYKTSYSYNRQQHTKSH